MFRGKNKMHIIMHVLGFFLGDSMFW